MRIFQNFGLYPAYFDRLRELGKAESTFNGLLKTFLEDRFGATHLLQPVLSRSTTAFFTNGDDERLQRQWASENNLRARVSLEDILLAQIEHHGTEVFYNVDPMRYGSGFVRRLPGCVKKSVAWRAAPSPGADFGAYDAILCNFPSILQTYRELGWRAEYFSPAHDPEMDAYAANWKRPIDVLFVGGYSRHHRRRAVVLEAVATLKGNREIVFCLDRSRLTRLAESPIGRLLPLAAHRRPGNIRAISRNPVFGRELYAMISQAKIVLNGAVDMAGSDRGNMRCFEAMGCGALMVSDQGRYPEGMQNEKTMLLYEGGGGAMGTVKHALAEWDASREIALRGHEMMRESYSKAKQWIDFVGLVGKL